MLEYINNHILKEFITMKMNLDNCDGLIDPREHAYDIMKNLDLFIQDNNTMSKMLSTIFYGYQWV